MPTHFTIDDTISIAVQPIRAMMKHDTIYGYSVIKNNYSIILHYKGGCRIEKSFTSLEERDNLYNKVAKAMESFNK